MPSRRSVLSAAALATAAGTVLPAGTATAAPARRPRRPLVIGHRGASGYRPEHTLAAYELAARLGADYIEPDLVITADGVLVARHEPVLAIVDPTTGALVERTTDVDVRPEFADRVRTKVLDGTPLTGWWAEDLTLAELKTLRAVERIPAVRQENTIYDGRYEVPTLVEVLDLRERLSRELRREIGVYPETKHPTYFQALGKPLEPPLVADLTRRGLNRRGAPVFVQSFEVANLRALRPQLRVPIVQLFGGSGAPYDFTVAGDARTYSDLASPAGLAEIAGYADGIGPNKDRVIARDAAGNLAAPTALVADAQRAGLLVHPYTFRNENQFLPADLRRGTIPADFGDALAEYAAFYATGIDGLFSDHPDTAVAALTAPAAPAAVPVPVP